MAEEKVFSLATWEAYVQETNGAETKDGEYKGPCTYYKEDRFKIYEDEFRVGTKIHLVKCRPNQSGRQFDGCYYYPATYYTGRECGPAIRLIGGYAEIRHEHTDAQLYYGGSSSSSNGNELQCDGQDSSSPCE